MLINLVLRKKAITSYFLLIDDPPVNCRKLHIKFDADPYMYDVNWHILTSILSYKVTLNVTMTYPINNINLDKPQKKIFLSFVIKFNEFTFGAVPIRAYILVNFTFFIHEFYKIYMVFFTLLKNI